MNVNHSFSLSQSFPPATSLTLPIYTNNAVQLSIISPQLEARNGSGGGHLKLQTCCLDSPPAQRMLLLSSSFNDATTTSSLPRESEREMVKNER